MEGATVMKDIDSLKKTQNYHDMEAWFKRACKFYDALWAYGLAVLFILGALLLALSLDGRR
jgi:uncharacterized membrane protein YhdT